MGIFDRIKDIVSAEVGYQKDQLNGGLKTPNLDNFGYDSLGNSGNTGAQINGYRGEQITFYALPISADQIKEFEEGKLDTPFKTAALTMAALCAYEFSAETAHEMLNFLKGPEPLNPAEKAMIKSKLEGKKYKALSFFEGAEAANDYRPATPYTITIYANPNSFNEENRATLYVKSAGADTPRPLKFRKKPSTNQWFLTDIGCLDDIKMPQELDPWA